MCERRLKSAALGLGWNLLRQVTCSKDQSFMQVSRALRGLVAGSSGSSVPRFPTAGAVLETTACHLPADFDLH